MPHGENTNSLEEALKALDEQLPGGAGAAPPIPPPKPAAPMAPDEDDEDDEGEDDEGVMSDEDREAVKAFATEIVAPVVEALIKEALKPVTKRLDAMRAEGESLKGLATANAKAAKVMIERLARLPAGGASPPVPGVAIGGTAPRPGGGNYVFPAEAEVQKAVDANEIDADVADYLVNGVLPPNWNAHQMNHLFPGGTFGGEG